MAFTYRTGLGRPLTYQEMDDNLEHVEDLADSASDSASSASDSAASAATHEQQAQIYAAAAQSAVGVPALAGNSGKALVVLENEQGVEWGPPSGLGTAAARDVGTGSGNLMEVGAFGLGDIAFQLQNGDLNDPRPTGFYYANQPMQNTPVGVNGWLLQQSLGEENFTQTYVTHGSPIRIFQRSKLETVYTPWTEKITTDNWYLGTDKQYTANATGSVTLNLTDFNIFDLTLTGNTALSASSLDVPAGETHSIVVRIRQGTTARTLTWWPGITWLSPATPAAPAANKMVEYVLSYTAASGWLGRVGAGN